MTTTELSVGDCLFYQQKPMKLLYQKAPNVWHVRPIFLEGDDYDQTFNPHDTVTLLHSRR